MTPFLPVYGCGGCIPQQPYSIHEKYKKWCHWCHRVCPFRASHDCHKRTHFSRQSRNTCLGSTRTHVWERGNKKAKTMRTEIVNLLKRRGHAWILPQTTDGAHPEPRAVTHTFTHGNGSVLRLRDRGTHLHGVLRWTGPLDLPNRQRALRWLSPLCAQHGRKPLVITTPTSGLFVLSPTRDNGLAN
jgi:hypothetical protein